MYFRLGKPLSRPARRTALPSAAQWRDPRISLSPKPQSRKVAITLSLLLLLTFSPAAHAQGCTQCRDNAAATPPKTQAAYRHAIILLVVTAGTLFTGTIVLLKRPR